MAEKPRLKETDEIFDKLGKAALKSPLPLDSEGLAIPNLVSESATPGLISSLVDPPEPPRRRRNSNKTAAPKEPVADRRPLDFGKYGMGGEGEREEPQPNMRKRKTDSQAVSAEQEEKPGPPRVKRTAPPAEPGPPKMRRVSPASAKAEKAPPTEQSAPPEIDLDALVQPFVFEDFESPPTEKPPAPRIVRPAAAKTPTQQSKPLDDEDDGPPPEQEAAPARPKPAARRTKQADQPPAQNDAPQERPPKKKSKPPTPGRDPEIERDEILKQLSSQFDEAFNEAFEGGRADKPDEPPKAARKGKGKARPKPATPGKDAPVGEKVSKGKPVSRRFEPEELTPDTDPPEPEFGRAGLADEYELPMAEQLMPPVEDPMAAAEADSFLEEFAKQIQGEEENRTELFKDTLAEKFERERSRYLRELGIEKGGGPEKFSPPTTRRLDIQIEPEMHTEKPQRKGERPVTYSRVGQVRTMQPDEGADAAPVATRRAKKSAAGGDKKSTEELLLELAVQKTEASINGASRRPPPRMLAEGEWNEALAAEPEVKEKKESFFAKGNRKMMTIAGLAAAVLLIPTVVLMMSVFRPSETGENMFVADTPGMMEMMSGNTLNVTESRSFSERALYENVHIHRANVSLNNIAVENILLIEGIEAIGEVRLDDVSVNGAIHLRSGGVNDLVLHNVSASRLIIANERAGVNVSLTGNSGVGEIEIQTPAGVRVIPAQGASAPVGVGSVRLAAAPEVAVLNVTLDGIEIDALDSLGEAILEIGQDTRVERLSSEGSMSISGEGRVNNLFASPRQSGGSAVLRLDTPIHHLAITGPGDITLHSQINSMATADHLTLSGSGSVSSLTINQPADRGRVSLNLNDSLVVNAVIANAQLTAHSGDYSRINELIANESVHALGNNVNSLVVNAAGVIYEAEPDIVQVAGGIAPPQSAADNPNIDFSQVNPVPYISYGSADTGAGGFTHGNGSRENPFQVSTPAQLAYVGQHLTSHFVQTGDIDIDSDTQFIAGFTPIGSPGQPFTGSFDGGGFAIRNLRITSDSSSVGLFAENAGEIENVSLVSGEIRATGSEPAVVGGIAGRNLSAGLIAASSNGARIIGGTGSHVGGIAGHNLGGRIRDVYNGAIITGTTNTGGILGVNDTGGTLSGSYNIGSVEGIGEGVGSVVGTNRGIVTNTYFLDGTATAGIGEGGGSAMSRTSGELSSAQMVADLAAGNIDSPWTQSEGGSFNFPVLLRP